jgi:hypothetical protein
MTINIGAFAPVDSVQYQIRAVDGRTDTGISVDILSAAHPKAQAYSTAQATKNLRRQAQMEAQQINGRKVKPEERTPDEVRAENVALVVSRLGGWTPFVIPEFGDNPVEFSDEAAAKWLSMPRYGWVYLQLLEFIADENNFIKGSALT